jgi:hypothetical protein
VLFAIYAPPGRDRIVVRPGIKTRGRYKPLFGAAKAAVNDIYDSTPRQTPRPGAKARPGSVYWRADVRLLPTISARQRIGR